MRDFLTRAAAAITRSVLAQGTPGTIHEAPLALWRDVNGDGGSETAADGDDTEAEAEPELQSLAEAGITALVIEGEAVTALRARIGTWRRERRAVRRVTCFHQPPVNFDRSQGSAKSLCSRAGYEEGIATKGWHRMTGFRELSTKHFLTLLALMVLGGCGSRPYLPPGHEGGATTPYPMTYTKQASNPGLRYGMYYSRDNYRHCQQLYGADKDRRNITCDYLLLTRPDIPEYWPKGAPPPIQYPPPPAEPTYKAGMTSEQYFNALCEKESGDFVFRTAENVEGIYLIRPRYYQGDQIRRELFANEAPYEETGLLQIGVDRFSYLSKNYRYVEFPDVKNHPAEYIPPLNDDSPNMRFRFRDQAGSGPYWRYWWDNEIDRNDRFATSRYYRQRIPSPQSRYGITWRAIERTGFDRDLGVAGMEVLIVDLNSGEVLAVRRGFARAFMGKPMPLHGHTGNVWGRDLQCPVKGARPEVGSANSFPDFLMKVLNPAAPLNSAKGK